MRTGRRFPALIPRRRRLQQALPLRHRIRWSWLYPGALKKFGEDVQFDLFEVRAGDEIVGLMPLRAGARNVPALPTPKSGISGIITLFGMLCWSHRRWPIRFSPPWMTTMAETGDWHMLLLENIPADGIMLSQLDGAMAGQNLLKDAPET